MFIQVKGIPMIESISQLIDAIGGEMAFERGSDPPIF